MKIFSYGSNMLPVRIKNRIDSYKVIEKGFLENHLLRFHKKSKDGSGKADAFFTGNRNDTVWGVIGEVDEKSKIILDEIEGLNKGYIQKEVEINIEKGTERAIIYKADKIYIFPKLFPYDWYKEYVLKGSIFYSFPKEYIDSIENIPYKRDLDTKRRERNFKIINEVGI